jgi:histidinol-phosphatase
MDDLSLALTLADHADAITMRHFRRSDLRVRSKVDHSPVSAADLETERALRSLIREHRPGDGILGEELDETPGQGRRWILDPIDHTDNYTRGVEVFATLIALEEDGRVTVGVVSAPALGRRWWAARGQGAYVREGEASTRIRVSAVDDLAGAHVSHASLRGWERRGLVPGIVRVCRNARYVFGSGCFWAQMLVAEGRCDVSLDPWGKVWDIAASQVILEEAGGRLTDLRGEPRIDQDCAVATNGLLHQEILGLLTG